jgi:hypothetical protein
MPAAELRSVPDAEQPSGIPMEETTSRARKGTSGALERARGSAPLDVEPSRRRCLVHRPRRFRTPSNTEVLVTPPKWDGGDLDGGWA